MRFCVAALLVCLCGLNTISGQDDQGVPQFQKPKVIRYQDLLQHQGVNVPTVRTNLQSEKNSKERRIDDIIARVNNRASLISTLPPFGVSPTSGSKTVPSEPETSDIPVASGIPQDFGGGSLAGGNGLTNSPWGNLKISPTTANLLGILPQNAAAQPNGLASGLNGLSPALLSGLQNGQFGNLPASIQSALAGASSNGLGVNPGIPQTPGAFGAVPAGANPAATSGLVSAMSALASQLGRSLGLGSLLNQAGLGSLAAPFSGAQQVGAANPGAGLRGPPVPGFPAIPGLNLQPGAKQQFDVMGLVGGLSRKALNGSTVADVLPPNKIEQFAENLTDTLVPEMPDLDLTKYMGRWFEGIDSPRASSQRCVVHHYGGLTENGKTATFTALKIYRDGNEFGQVQYSIGYAFRGGRQKSMLQMHSSESQDAIPYWIYKVGPEGKDSFGHGQYDYAIISNWIKYPVMVLVRDPDSFKKTYEVEVLRWLEDHGFINDFARTFNLIQPVDYSNCQYSDSTFAAFGK